MVIVQLAGGLGNQLFEYAVGRQVAAINRCKLKLDAVSGFHSDTFYRRTYALTPFNIKVEFSTQRDLEVVWTPRRGYRIGKMLQIVRKVLPESVARHVPAWGSLVFTEETQFAFDHRLLKPTTNNVFLRGYWQNPRYFEALEDVLRKEFTLRNALSARAVEYERAIGSMSSVGVHFRRLHGRAFGNVSAEGVALHGCLGMDYYEQAIRSVKVVCNDAHFFVFADDPQWAAEHLHLDGPTTFVTGNADYEDLILMSRCQHQVIANSSFGWWAAWLNPNPRKHVVAPRTYMADANYDTRALYPKAWTVI